MLHKAKKMNPDSIVVAVGCYAQTDTEGAKEDDAVDIIVGNNNKRQITSIIKEYIKEHGNDTVVTDLSVPVEFEDYSLTGSNERTRVDLKIQDGCNQFCSYCIIPHARGRIRSRQVKSVIEEVTTLAEKGFKEIVLTGIHLSSYGLEWHTDANGKYKAYNELAKDGSFTNKDLLEIINSVTKVKGIERIRLGSLEPRIITEEFLEAISNNEKICAHFHLSLQSGCDETLKRMNRHYSSKEFAEKVDLIRKYYKHPAITTDIIVGFPGETEDEFDTTVAFVRKINFYETHVFKYSKRSGTPAATMPNQLTEAVKGQRSDVLIEISDSNSKAFREAFLGEELEILTERREMIDGVEYVTGHTKDYVKCAMNTSAEENELIKGVAEAFLKNDIILLK